MNENGKTNEKQARTPLVLLDQSLIQTLQQHHEEQSQPDSASDFSNDSRDPYISVSDMSSVTASSPPSYYSPLSLDESVMSVIDECKPLSGDQKPSLYRMHEKCSRTGSQMPQTDFRTRTRKSTCAIASPCVPSFSQSKKSLSQGTDNSNDKESLEENNAVVRPTDSLHNSMATISISICLGIALGALLITMQASPLVLKWVALPGSLFYRAIKCIIVPYIFCAVAVAMGDISFAGRVSALGVETAKVFALFWFASSIVGMSTALSFRPLFRAIGVVATTSSNAVSFFCENDQQLMLGKTNRLYCDVNPRDLSVVSNSLNQRDIVIGNDPAMFVLDDLTKYFAESPERQVDLQKQLLTQAGDFVPSNIVESMYNMELLGVITFGSFLGVIAGQQYYARTRQVNYLYATLLQLRNAFFWAIKLIIRFTPGAIISLIAGILAENQDMFVYKRIAYLYVAAMSLAIFIQVFVALPLLVFLCARRNPYKQMRHMLHAYLFGIAVSSSLAAAPVTLHCIKEAKICTAALANFVISFGTVTNLSAAALLIPVTTVFLAETAGLGEQLTAIKLLQLTFISWLGCMGIAPIPNGHLVLIGTAYSAVLGIQELPSTYALILAVDFFIDRLITIVNVNDDIMALEIIAERINECAIQELAGQRY